MENFALWEYLSIIEPNGLIKSDITALKIKCRNEYGWESSPPHLTVFNLIQPLSNEQRLIKCLERNIVNVSPFQIDFCGFDYFSTPDYTLYLKLKDEKQFSEMASYISRFLKPVLRSVKDYPPRYTTKNAHLTIAKGISELEFSKVWPKWENLEYRSGTVAAQILLLRRPFVYVRPKYELVGKYPFLGKGPLVRQTILF